MKPIEMTQTTNIDEGLYSRQLFVLGKEAMLSLSGSNILLVGLGGLGVEIGKNITLAGVGSLTLLDNTLVQWSDLSSNYYLKESDVGSVTRAQACFHKLVELNGHVHIKLHLDDPPSVDCKWPIDSKILENNEFLKNFHLIVLTECGHNYEFVKNFNVLCHSLGVKLIVANTYGVCGQVFCDLGDTFHVKDANGEDPVSIPIADIQQLEDDTLVHFMERHFYRIFPGDLVTFSGVKGMEELNGQKRTVCEIIDPQTISIGSTQGMSSYISGGTLIEAKVEKEMHFKRYDDAEKDVDVDKDGVEIYKLHLLFRALSQFYSIHGRLPSPWNEDDADAFSTLVEQLEIGSIKGSSVEMKYRKLFSYTCQGNVAPIQAIFGGFAAQEVMKACTGKFTPLHQWMYSDFFECLPDHLEPEMAVSPSGCGKRFTGQVSVFGRNIQLQLQKSSWFVIGAGAIGCEVLKNFAMMGIASKEGLEDNTAGCVTVTDMDSIERSNLNRQFLFRNDNIGQNKAIVAAGAVKEMHQYFNVVAQINKVGVETEHIYTDDFYTKQTGLVNALDNVEARRYTDGRSHFYGLPLLESGTQGTQGHTQMIVPHVTCGYAASPENSSAKIAICTLKNFPYLIQHTIQWARDVFEGLFAQPSRLARRFLEDRESLLQHVSTLPYHEALDSLKKVHSIVANPPTSPQDCVQWAYNLWHENYRNNILQLLYNYPPDHEIDGMLFWSTTKRMPHPLTFDETQAIHLDFIRAGASIKAEMFTIEHHFEEPDFLSKCLQSVSTNEFHINKELRIGANDNEEEAIRNSQLASLREQVEQLTADLRQLNVMEGLVLNNVEFEKDDDTNHHIDFVTAASNLRALNYDIEPVDRLKTKRIAGRIIPAIATTTAVTTGLICLEIYKLFNGSDDKDKYRENSVELASPHIYKHFCASAKKIPNTPFNEWSIFRDAELRNMTLREFMSYFEIKHNCPLSGVLYGNALLYPRLSSLEEDEKVLNMEMKQLVEYVQQKPVESFRKSIAFNLVSSDDDIEQLPKAVYSID